LHKDSILIGSSVNGYYLLAGYLEFEIEIEIEIELELELELDS